MGSGSSIKAGKAYVEMGADNSKLVAGLKAASARLKAFGAQVSRIGAGVAMAGSAVAAPLVAASKHFASTGDAIAKMGRRTGVSVEALSWLSFAAERSGTDLGSLEKGLQRMQRSLYDAARGSSTAVDALAELGLTSADLDGKLPEEQFRTLGAAIDRVQDPSKKAALAMTLLGRSGTALLPMFEGGAAAMDAYKKKAAELGVIISTQDARAAETFTDAMGDLLTVVKMSVFSVGASLQPVLESTAEAITTVAAQVKAWIDQNRDLIATIFKVAVGVAAAGAAMFAAGKIIGTVGVALHGLAVVLPVVKGAILALASPLGLVAAATVGAGIAIARYTSVGQKAMAWLGSRFGQLRDDAVSAVGAIGEALASGDLAGAAKVAWAFLKLTWARGVLALTETWNTLKGAFIAAVDKTFDAIGLSLTEVVNTLRNIWATFVDWLKSTYAKAVGEVAKQMIADETLKEDRRIKADEKAGKISPEEAKRQREWNRKRYHEALGIQDASTQTKLEDIKYQRRQAQERQAFEDNFVGPREDPLRAQREALREAQAGFEASKSGVRSSADQRAMDAESDRLMAGGLMTELAAAAAAPGAEALAAAANGPTSTAATFRAGSLGGLGIGRDYLQKQIATATQDTAEGVKKMVQKMEQQFAADVVAP